MQPQLSQQLNKIIRSHYHSQTNILAISYNPLCHDILTFRDWSQTKELYFWHCAINDSTIKQISSMEWPQLQLLDIMWNQVTSKGIADFIKKEWTKLDKLNISHNKIGDEGLYLLLNKLNLFKSLQICNCTISARGIQSLLDIKFDSLCKLNLSSNKIGSRGTKWLTKINLINLNHLNISNCQLGDEGAKYLTKSLFPNLTFLNLQINYIKSNSVFMLHESSWRKMEKIYTYQELLISCCSYVLTECYNARINRSFYPNQCSEMDRSIEDIIIGRNLWNDN